jgi:hypothetical protein
MAETILFQSRQLKRDYPCVFAANAFRLHCCTLPMRTNPAQSPDFVVNRCSFVTNLCLLRFCTLIYLLNSDISSVILGVINTKLSDYDVTLEA